MLLLYLLACLYASNSFIENNTKQTNFKFKKRRRGGEIIFFQIEIKLKQKDDEIGGGSYIKSQRERGDI